MLHSTLWFLQFRNYFLFIVLHFFSHSSSDFLSLSLSTWKQVRVELTRKASDRNFIPTDPKWLSVDKTWHPYWSKNFNKNFSFFDKVIATQIQLVQFRINFQCFADHSNSFSLNVVVFTFITVCLLRNHLFLSNEYYQDLGWSM